MPSFLRLGGQLRLASLSNRSSYFSFINYPGSVLKLKSPPNLIFKDSLCSKFKISKLDLPSPAKSSRCKKNCPPSLVYGGCKFGLVRKVRLFSSNKVPYLFLLAPVFIPAEICETIEDIEPSVARLSERSRLRRFLDALYSWLDKYLLEPIFVGCRFGYLVFNFLPVLLLAPVCYVGKKVPDKDNEPEGALWWYSFLTQRMEAAGAAFIKLAQWAASRSDIFPTQLCLALSKLHSTAKPHSLEETERIIFETFGQEISELFLDFEPEPMGVGAIAQVYRARIKPGARPEIETNKLDSELAVKERARDRPCPDYVAIKVLHPHVHSIVEGDLRVMGFLANLLNLVPTLSWLSLPGEVETFGAMMRAQLDLRIEAQNLLQLRENFDAIFTAKFPRPLVDWVSPNVLVEKYEFGVPMKYFLQAKERSPYDVSISAIGLDCFLHMLIFDNFTHADLHPGNIMIKFHRPTAGGFFRRIFSLVSGDKLVDESAELSKNLLEHGVGTPGFDEAICNLYNQGYYPRLIFLDAGLVASLDDVNRRNFLDLFQAIAEFDGYKAGRLMVERCRSPELVENGDAFALKMQHLILSIKSKTFQLSKIDISSLLQTVMQMVREHRVKLEGDFVNVVISILILEGIGRSLNPELDLFKMALPILRSYGTQEGKRNGLAGLQTLPGGGSRWLKLWFQLEARQMLSGMILESDSIDVFLFGQFKPFLLD